MIYSNSRIQPTIGDIPLDIIDCFDRAIGICLSSFDKSYADLYFCLKLFNRVYFSNPTEKFFLSESLKGINTFFPLEVKKVDISDNITLVLEEECRKGNPIIIPINLREIFYSEQYQALDWAHPFVIKGFDNEKKVFKILDGTQLKNDVPEEREFFVLYDILANSYNSYFENINTIEKPYVIVFEENRSSPFDSGRDNTNFEKNILITLINKVKVKNQFQIIETEKNVATILNFSKRKNMLFEIILKRIENLDSLQIEIENLKLQISKICDYWDEKCFLYVKNKLSKKTTEKFNVEKKIILKEVSVFQEIISILKKIETKKLLKDNINNKNIISVNENETIFNFNGERIYNSWLSDESPKVILENGKISEFEEEYYIKIEEKNVSVVAGFFLNLSEKLYYFGLDSCKRINIDIAGIESTVRQAIVETDSVYLKLVLRDEVLSFKYKVTEKESYTVLMNMGLSANKIKTYGIGCKTYNQPKTLKVLFRNIKYKECE
ncbi:TPA: hypothetical protein VAT55_000797 [Streptococcus agalactiae]|nr:hypothetical protein [Streptococcus agalactiae]